VNIIINKARLAFPVLWKPETVNGEGKAAFSAALLIPKDHATITAPNQRVVKKDASTGADKIYLTNINAAIEHVAKEEWKDQSAAILKTLKAQDRICLHDGDNKPGYDGYPGNFYISARSQTRPSVIDGQRNPLTETDGKPYSGCYVNAILVLWAQDHSKGGKRVNAQLAGIQFLADGDSFGGGRAAQPDEFEALAVSGGADDLI
jgi:hypothetical protein